MFQFYYSIIVISHAHNSAFIRERNNSIHLTLHQLKSLDRAIHEQFQAWLDAAHNSYKDNFMRTHQPIAIMLLYGQNQPLTLDGDEEEEDFGNWS